MHKHSHPLKAFYNKLLVVLNYISVGLIFAMALGVTADVIGRYFFNHPIPGTTESVKCAIIAIVFLGIAYTYQRGRHIRTSILLVRLGTGGNDWLDMLAHALGLFIFVLLTIYSFQAAWSSWLVREFDGVQVMVPVYPSRFVVVLGSSLLAIESALQLTRRIQSIIRNDGERLP